MATLVCSGVVAISVATASPMALATCTASRLSAQDTTTSRPGVTKVRLVMTNLRKPACVWSPATGFQFVSSTGVALGPVVTDTSRSGGAARSVLMTFQIAVNVSTMEGVRCTTRIAPRLRVVTPDHRSVMVMLAHSVGVCVGGHTRWTSVSSATFPRVPRCRGAQLRVSAGPANGAAGTSYVPLRLTNVGSSACSVSGTPTVQPLDGATASSSPTAIGPPARVINLSTYGFVNPVRLAPFDTASAPYGIVDAGNYPSTQCSSRPARSLAISLAGIGTWWLAMRISVCTKLASTSISNLVAGSSGLGPTP